MAIVKLKNGKFQAKVKGPDGKWITQCFPSRRDARRFEAEVRERLRTNRLVSSSDRHLTVDAYFVEWFASREHQTSKGWRREQSFHYERYVRPHIGFIKLHQVTPALVAKILVSMTREGKAEQTKLHVFNLIRKMFGDAIELFQLLTFNPAIRSLKPKIPVKESRHLSLKQAVILLEYVKDRPFGTAIWLQLYLGLRVGELQALRWSDLNLEEGWVHIHRTYVRKEKAFKDYPKGRKQHSIKIPPELLSYLRRLKKEGSYVVTRPDGEMLEYEWYRETLQRYCEACGVPKIGTHGLRHTTSKLYLSHGACQDDIVRLFAHSSSRVTERYIHERGAQLERVSSTIRLFPSRT